MSANHPTQNLMDSIVDFKKLLASGFCPPSSLGKTDEESSDDDDDKGKSRYLSSSPKHGNDFVGGESEDSRISMEKKSTFVLNAIHKTNSISTTAVYHGLDTSPNDEQPATFSPSSHNFPRQSNTKPQIPEKLEGRTRYPSIVEEPTTNEESNQEENSPPNSKPRSSLAESINTLEDAAISNPPLAMKSEYDVEEIPDKPPNCTKQLIVVFFIVIICAIFLQNVIKEHGVTIDKILQIPNDLRQEAFRKKWGDREKHQVDPSKKERDGFAKAEIGLSLEEDEELQPATKEVKEELQFHSAIEEEDHIEDEFGSNIHQEVSNLGPPDEARDLDAEEAVLLKMERGRDETGTKDAEESIQDNSDLKAQHDIEADDSFRLKAGEDVELKSEDSTALNNEAEEDISAEAEAAKQTSEEELVLYSDEETDKKAAEMLLASTAEASTETLLEGPHHKIGDESVANQDADNEATVAKIEDDAQIEGAESFAVAEKQEDLLKVEEDKEDKNSFDEDKEEQIAIEANGEEEEVPTSISPEETSVTTESDRTIPTTNGEDEETPPEDLLKRYAKPDGIAENATMIFYKLGYDDIGIYLSRCKAHVNKGSMEEKLYPSLYMKCSNWQKTGSN